MTLTYINYITDRQLCDKYVLKSETFATLYVL